MTVKTFKVFTKWTGYSEITVQAETKRQASDLVEEKNFDPNNEVWTGNGLDYGYENEEIIEVEEIKAHANNC